MAMTANISSNQNNKTPRKEPRFNLSFKLIAILLGITSIILSLVNMVLDVLAKEDKDDMFYAIMTLTKGYYTNWMFKVGVGILIITYFCIILVFLNDSLSSTKICFYIAKIIQLLGPGLVYVFRILNHKKNWTNWTDTVYLIICAVIVGLSELVSIYCYLNTYDSNGIIKLFICSSLITGAGLNQIILLLIFGLVMLACLFFTVLIFRLALAIREFGETRSPGEFVDAFTSTGEFIGSIFIRW